MAEVNNQEIIQHKSIINDGTVFTEYFICNDSNSEKQKYIMLVTFVIIVLI